jgi:8-oxo-dGTP diphosphatase
VEQRTAADVTAARKRRLSKVLRGSWPLRALMKAAARVLAPRQPVGAVGVVVRADGCVLLVEHVLRTDFPWGLPGGYVNRGEEPREAVRREIEEELGLHVEAGRLLAAEQVGLTPASTHPRHLGLAYACTLAGGACVPGREVVSVEWVRPDAITRTLAPLQRRAIELATTAKADTPTPGNGGVERA